MSIITTVTRIFWALSTIGCVYGYIHDLDSVAWFASLLSAFIPLLASTVLSGDRWDRSFLSILIYTLDGVALGIASAHFVMFGLHPWSLSLVPLFSGLAWWLHERNKVR